MLPSSRGLPQLFETLRETPAVHQKQNAIVRQTDLAGLADPTPPPIKPAGERYGVATGTACAQQSGILRRTPATL